MYDPTQPDSDENSRLMIFVGNRRLTFLLRDWINNLDTGYKCERVVSTLIAPSDYGKCMDHKGNNPLWYEPSN